MRLTIIGAALTALVLASLSPASVAAAKKVAAPKEPRPAESDRFAKAEDGRTKILVLPPEFKLFQLGASGVSTHEVPEWSLEAEGFAADALRMLGASSKRFLPVEMPKVSADEQALIAEHLALADNVTFAAFQNRQFGGKAWKHKQTDFDYTLGPQLAFLRERSGADVAAFTVGVETISTGGRVAMGILFAAAGVGIPMGQTFIIMGVVDLETGQLLWVNQRYGSSGFRDRVRVAAYIDGLMCQYPYGTVMGDKPKSCDREWEQTADGVVQPVPTKDKTGKSKTAKTR
jgi:hypothetical protein